MTFHPTRHIAAATLLFANIAFSDQVILRNGDRITGSLVKKDQKSLTFKSDVLGKITVPWDKVQSLTAEKPVFVMLPGKEEAILPQSNPKGIT